MMQGGRGKCCFFHVCVCTVCRSTVPRRILSAFLLYVASSPSVGISLVRVVMAIEMLLVYCHYLRVAGVSKRQIFLAIDGTSNKL